MSIFSDISLVAKNHTTYDVGLLQARGYRTLKHMTAHVLRPEGLTTTEWAIIGIISHHPKGVRTTKISEALSVQAPLVSRLLIKTEASGWITIEPGEDKRERVVSLSKKGLKNISRIEKNVREGLAPLLKGVSAKDLAGYLRTLDTISKNGKGLPPAVFEDYLPD